MRTTETTNEGDKTMRTITIGECQFLTQGCSPEDVTEWKEKLRIVKRRALGRNVLVVARTRIEGKWAAYIDAVPGRNHAHEEAAVLDHGTKLLEEVARVLFPQFDDIPYAK